MFGPPVEGSFGELAKERVAKEGPRRNRVAMLVRDVLAEEEREKVTERGH